MMEGSVGLRNLLGRTARRVLLSHMSFRMNDRNHRRRNKSLMLLLRLVFQFLNYYNKSLILF